MELRACSCNEGGTEAIPPFFCNVILSEAAQPRLSTPTCSYCCHPERGGTSRESKDRDGPCRASPLVAFGPACAIELYLNRLFDGQSRRSAVAGEKRDAAIASSLQWLTAATQGCIGVVVHESFAVESSAHAACRMLSSEIEAASRLSIRPACKRGQNGL